MSGDAQLMLMIAGMHLLGLVCAAALIVPALRDRPDFPRAEGGSNDDGGPGKRRPPAAPRDRPGGGLPLPDAVPARARLRDHRRLAELLPPRRRRPAHAPDRRPVPTRRRG